MLKKWLLGVCLLILPLAVVSAQEETEPETDPGAWEYVFGGVAGVAYPPDWSVGANAQGQLAITSPDEAITVEFQLIEFSQTVTLDFLESELSAAYGTDLITVSAFDKPAGRGMQAQAEIIVEGDIPVQLVQYIWPYGGESGVLFQGAFVEAALDEATTAEDALAIIDTIANTMRIDADTLDPWTEYANATGTAAILAPAGFEALNQTDTTVTLTNQETLAVVVMTAVDLGATVEVATLEDTMRESLEERGATIDSLMLVDRPPGPSLVAQMTIPGDAEANTPDRQEWQYYIIQGQFLIITSASVPVENAESEADLLQTMLDTAMIQVEPEAEDTESDE